MRQNRIEQQRILAAMLNEARRRSAEGLPIKEVVQHVAQVRDDLKAAAAQGWTIESSTSGTQDTQVSEDPAEKPQESSTEKVVGNGTCLRPPDQVR